MQIPQHKKVELEYGAGRATMLVVDSDFDSGNISSASYDALTDQVR